MLRFHGDGATSAVEDAAVNYQSPSIIAAGADAQGVSVITTVINLCLAMVCFKAPGLIEKAGMAKRGAVILAFLNLLAWVPLTLAFFLSRLGITPGWFALLWFINVVPGMLLSFQRDNWLSNLIPHGTLGRYLGQRLAIKSAFYLAAFFLLGYLLDSFGKNDLAGFAVVFTIAIAVGLIDFIIFTFMSEKKPAEPQLPQPEAVKFSLPNYFSELKEKKLDTFIIFTTFFYLTVGFSGPLYAVYMLNELHFSYLSFTLIISAEYLARVVSAPFWGRFADKSGNIKVLGIVSRIIPIIPVCWLFCHNLGYLVFIQILSGACWGAFDLSTQSYLYKVAPRPKKLRYIIYTRCLVLLCTAAGGLLGAFCVNGIFPTFGSKILSIFMLSGIARALVVMCLMPKLVDLAVSFGQAPKPPEIDLETFDRIMTSRRGQFYKREKQAELAAARLQQTGETATSVAGRTALYRQSSPAKSSLLIQGPVPATKIAFRLSHYHEAMAARAVKPPAPIQYHSLEPNAARLELRYDLERQLKALANQAEEAMSYHGLEENTARLKLRYQINPREETSNVLAEKAMTHHDIGQNIERLKQRYHLSPQPAAAAPLPEKTSFRIRQEPATAAPKANPAAGLYRDKVSWTRYMKETLDTALREIRQGQPVPVPISSDSRSGLSGSFNARNIAPNSSYRRSPVLA